MNLNVASVLDEISLLKWSGAVPSPRGAFGGLAPSNKAPSPPKWNMKHCKSVEILSVLSPPAQIQSPPIENFLATVLLEKLIYYM